MKVQTNVKAGQVTIGDQAPTNTNTTTQNNAVSITFGNVTQQTAP